MQARCPGASTVAAALRYAWPAGSAASIASASGPATTRHTGPGSIAVAQIEQRRSTAHR